MYGGLEAQKPLVRAMSNSWQEKGPAYATFESEDDLENERSQARVVQQCMLSRRTRTVLVVLLVFLVTSLWAWKWYLRLLPDTELENFLRAQSNQIDIEKTHNFDGTRMQALPAELIPGGVADAEGKRRLVFVGDIHGCADELQKLLKRVKFDESTDHLIAVGDTISKGPKNVEVLDELLSLNATSVRGNHEDRVLQLAPSKLGSLPDLTTTRSHKKTDKDTALLHELSDRHLTYLQNMPLMLRIPPLPSTTTTTSHHQKKTHHHHTLDSEILVVHAGLVPAVPLPEQDPFFVMNMRAIRTKTHTPLANAEDTRAKSKPWHDIWNWYNDRLSKHKSVRGYASEEGWLGTWGVSSASKDTYPDPQVIVYGHHSKEGLQDRRWSKGLDTGCVRGGRLTALVLDARGGQEIVSVRCQDHR